MKKLTLIIVALAFFGGAMAQKNIVKYNPFGTILYKTVPLSYERVLAEKLSVSLGVGVRIPSYIGGKAGEFLSDTASFGSSGFGIDKLKGYFFTPEIKFYPGKKGHGKGFYLGPYYRYSKYWTGMSASYVDKDGFNYDFDADIAIKTSGIGLQLGAQWLIKDKFAIDFYFLGPRYEMKKIIAYVESDDVNNWDQLAVSFEDDINNTISEYPMLGKFSAEAGSDNVKLSMPFSIINYRFGLSFGYAF